MRIRYHYGNYFFDENINKEFFASIALLWGLVPLGWGVLFMVTLIVSLFCNPHAARPRADFGCVCEEGLAACGDYRRYTHYTSAKGKLVMCVQGPPDNPGWNRCPDHSHRVAGKPCPELVGTHPYNGRSNLNYCLLHESLPLRLAEMPMRVACWFYTSFSWEVLVGMHLVGLLFWRVCLTAYYFPDDGNLFARVVQWFRNDEPRPNPQRVARRGVPHFVPGQRRVKLPNPFRREVTAQAPLVARLRVVRPPTDRNDNEPRNRLLDLGLDEL